MRILLDHCVDRHFARLLPGHLVKTARAAGWDALQNGKLLAAAAGQFDVMITVDQNLRYQQNLAALPIAVLVMVAKSNKLSELALLVPAVEKALVELKPCMIVEVAL